MVQDDLTHDGVVSRLPYRPDARFAAVSAVRAYWEALRNGRDTPFRSEIDPRGIESALEHTFILERIAPRLARFRLAGAHLNMLMGMEVRGMPLTAFFTAATRGDSEAILARVFDGPETAELTLVPEAATRRPGIEARMLLLPLRSDLGDVSRALGCLVATGRTGPIPMRFDIAGARLVQTIGAGRPQARGFGEPHTAFRSRAARPDIAGQPHLRLVVSHRDQ